MLLRVGSKDRRWLARMALCLLNTYRKFRSAITARYGARSNWSNFTPTVKCKRRSWGTSSSRVAGAVKFDAAKSGGVASYRLLPDSVTPPSMLIAALVRGSNRHSEPVLAAIRGDVPFLGGRGIPHRSEWASGTKTNSVKR